MSKTTKWILLGAGAFVALYLWRSKSAGVPAEMATRGAAVAPPELESGSAYVVEADVIPAAGVSLAHRGAQIGLEATVYPAPERRGAISTAKRAVASRMLSPIETATGLAEKVPGLGEVVAPANNWIQGEVEAFRDSGWQTNAKTLLTGGIRRLKRW